MNDFLSNIGNASHRPLLWLALQETNDMTAPVLEMGMGEGSTSYLHGYCAARGRRLLSVDNNQTWVAAFKQFETPTHKILCASWDCNIPSMEPFWSVVLVDHAPAERRHVDVEQLAYKAQFVVLHDTEARSPGYMYDRVFPLFKYRANIVVEAPYADAAVVSNFVDVAKWSGMRFDGYPYGVTA